MYSPVYEKGHSERMKDVRRMARFYDVPFWDYSNNQQLIYPELFKDKTHLNDEGANKFTEILAKEINKLNINSK